MPNNRLCECQCGQTARSKRKFLPGHSIATAKLWRTDEAKHRKRERRGTITIRYPAPNIASRFSEEQ